MSGRAEPVGPEKDSTIKPLEPEGAMEHPPHTFTQITESAEHFEYLIPTSILFSEASFEHKVSAIWQRDGLLGVLRLVYYTALSAFGFLKFPVGEFELERIESTESYLEYTAKIDPNPIVQLIIFNNDSISKDDPRVLNSVEKVFGEIEKNLEDELDAIEKAEHSPSKLLHFLLKINQRFRDVEASKQVPYCEKAADTRIHKLEILEERVQRLLAEGTGIQLIQLYDAIQSEKRAITFSNQTDETRKHHLNYLNNLEHKYSEQMEGNLQKAEKELEQSVSVEAKQAHLNLITLQKKLEKAQGLLQRTEGQLEDLKRNMESLKKLPNELNKAKADLHDLEESHLEWQKEFAPIKENLAQLKRDDERQQELENIEKGNVKKREKGFFWGEEEVVQKLTLEEETKLTELRANEWQRTAKIIEFQKQSENLKTKMLEYSEELDSAQKKIATLEKQVRNSEAKEREYQNLLKKRTSDQARYKKEVEEIKSKLISNYQIANHETQNQTNGIKKYLESHFISSGLKTYNKNQPQMTLHDFLKDSLSQKEEKFSQFFKEELSKLSLSVDAPQIASYLRSIIS